MKRFTFLNKLNIYFNGDIRNGSVKLTQPRLSTEEILLDLDLVMCFGMEISLVSLLLLRCFESTAYTFLRLLDLFAFMS